MSNPKTEPTDNAKKDPDEWISGDDCRLASKPFESRSGNLSPAVAGKHHFLMTAKEG
jgi:hypothetical protein